MKKRQALEYLAQTVADYVENKFPLQYLTGEGVGGLPDQQHAQQLYDALTALGFYRAADATVEQCPPDER